MDIGNVYAALVQRACSMQAACRQCVGSVHAALNPPNPPGPGPVFLQYSSTSSILRESPKTVLWKHPCNSSKIPIDYQIINEISVPILVFG